jgi:hypothetical protein
VILFIAISHVLFFLFGFFSVYGIIAFKLQDQFDANNLGINLIGGLILLLGLIVWLMWYLRNNAFKQFYPITVNDLRKEFLLVFLIFLLCVKSHLSNPTNSSLYTHFTYHPLGSGSIKCQLI